MKVTRQASCGGSQQCLLPADPTMFVTDSDPVFLAAYKAGASYSIADNSSAVEGGEDSFATAGVGSQCTTYIQCQSVLAWDQQHCWMCMALCICRAYD